MSPARAEKVGGQPAIGPALLEDVALARAVKQIRRAGFSFAMAATRCARECIAALPNYAMAGPRTWFYYFHHAWRLGDLRSANSFDRGSALFLPGSRLLGPVAPWPYLPAYSLSRSMHFFRRESAGRTFSWDATCCRLFGLPLFAYLLLRSKTLLRYGQCSVEGSALRSALGFSPDSARGAVASEEPTVEMRS